ncbi:MAG: amidase [Gammaproteobacteria bacterium]|nr:amidase [Gammaproteobacteria bacterium]
MSFSLPEPDELKKLAKESSFSLSDEQAHEFLSYMQGFAEGYRYLDEQPDHLPEAGSSNRAFSLPSPAENPLGAWYVKCSIKETDSGPLLGKRIAVKDNIFVAELPFTAGASVLKGMHADYDATTVSRILEAGAEITGKSVCEYFCLSGGSCTAHNGVVDNPRKKGYTTGGSSSGSAALVVAGEVDMALGTDQGGSVRIPASLSGCYGMKASMGVVSYEGGMPMETSIDYIGPLTRSVEDNALLLEVLSGYSADPELNPWSRQYTAVLGKPVEGMKIGIVKEGFGHPAGNPEVDKCVRQAATRLQELGAAVEDVSVPMHDVGMGIWGAVVTEGLWRTAELNGLGYNYESSYSPALYEAMSGVTDRLGEMPFNAQILFLLGKYLARYNGKYYAKAKNQVNALRAAYDKEFKKFDILLMPTTVNTAVKNPTSLETATNEELIGYAFNNTFNTCQFNATGHPAMSLPCGLRDDLPVGLMLIGRRFQESQIYQLAHAYEQAVDWQSE